MKEAATQQAQDWLTWLLAGIGLSLAPYQFFGGLFLALAVASILAGHRKDHRQIWLSLLTAAMGAIFVAAAWEHLQLQFPVQIGMAAAGVLGRPVSAFLVQLQDQIEARSAEIADRAIDRVLPGDDKKGGGDVS